MVQLGTAQVIRADSRHLPLADNTVDLVVTSPPYFALRSYQDGGQHYAGQVGDEATPAEFVASLLEVTRECVRVLKPSGSLWVNLGDKYSRGSRPLAQPDQFRSGSEITFADPKYVKNTAPENSGIAGKSLMGIPWRYALACIDDLGLILRAEVIWSKPNGLPESVTDRVRRSHEQWFHFTLEPRYFSGVDEIREAAAQNRPQSERAAALAAQYGLTDAHRAALLARGLGDQGRSATTQSGTGKNASDVLRLAAEADAALGSYTREFTLTSQQFGKLPGSVWTIPTQPLRVPQELGVDHFAAFPTELPKRIIEGWSPTGYCVECKDPRTPSRDTHLSWLTGRQECQARVGLSCNCSSPADHSEIAIRGLAYACACPEPTAATTPAVVLDPFGGTGTTAMVAKALGRHGISVDMSADYCRLAEWRTNDRDQLAKVLGIAKTDQPPADQGDLLDLLEGPAA